MSTNGPMPGPGPYGQQPPMPPQAPVPPQQQPPVPQQGYGYPQQQHAPAPQQGYGYPQQPMAPQLQQGYGYQQQFPGAPVPAAPPRKKKTGLIVLLVVALVVLGGAGGAAWYLLAGSPTEPLWSVEVKPQQGSDLTDVDGTWFTDKAVIQTASGGVKAYARDTGKKLWATPLPGAGNEACLAPSVSDGGIGIVAYGASGVDGAPGECNNVAAFALNSGKELWHRGFTGKELSVARTGETVVVRGKALKAADGSVAWDVKKSATPNCETGSYTGGKNLINLASCSKGDPLEGNQEKWTEVSLIDPATGKAEWTKKFGEDEVSTVLSSSPLVLSGYEGGFALDEKSGERRGKFPELEEKYLFHRGEGGGTTHEAAGFGNIFVMEVSKRDNPKGEQNALIAYDLDSGKELWKTEALDAIHYIPLRETSSERPLVYVTQSLKEPKLVEFDPKDGAMTTVVEYPEEVYRGMSVWTRPYWNKGTLYVSGTGSSVSFEGKAYSLIALPTTDS